MMIAGFDNLLRTNVAINALIGQRIWPLRLPELPTYPALTYQVVGGQSKMGLKNSGMQRVRMQIDCWGVNYADATTLRDTVIRELNGYSGYLSDGTYLQSIMLIQPTDFFDQDAVSYRCGAEIYIFHTF